jgi:hypothetical protein
MGPADSDHIILPLRLPQHLIKSSPCPLKDTQGKSKKNFPSTRLLLEGKERRPTIFSWAHFCERKSCSSPPWRSTSLSSSRKSKVRGAQLGGTHGSFSLLLIVTKFTPILLLYLAPVRDCYVPHWDSTALSFKGIENPGMYQGTQLDSLSAGGHNSGTCLLELCQWWIYLRDTCISHGHAPQRPASYRRAS